MAKSQAIQTTKNSNGLCAPADPKEEVAKLAYQFYVGRGYEHGHDQEDWLKAETTIKQQKTNR